MHRTSWNHPRHHEELQSSSPYGWVIAHQLSGRLQIGAQQSHAPVMVISEWPCRQQMARVMQVRQVGHMGVLDLVARTIVSGATIVGLDEEDERESIKFHAKF